MVVILLAHIYIKLRASPMIPDLKSETMYTRHMKFVGLKK